MVVISLHVLRLGLVRARAQSYLVKTITNHLSISNLIPNGAIPHGSIHCSLKAIQARKEGRIFVMRKLVCADWNTVNDLDNDLALFLDVWKELRSQ